MNDDDARGLEPTWLDASVNRITQWAAYLGGAGIVCLMLATVVDVTRRALFNTSIPGLLDATEVALVFVVYFGFAQAEADKSHIRTSFVTERIPRTVRSVVTVLTWGLVLVFLVWATQLTAQAAYTSWDMGESRASQSAIPVWPARAMVSVGLLGLALQSLLNVVRGVRELVVGRASTTTSAPTIATRDKEARP